MRCLDPYSSHSIYQYLGYFFANNGAYTLHRKDPLTVTPPEGVFILSHAACKTPLTTLTAYSARHPHSNGDPTHRLLHPSPTRQWRPDSPFTPPVTHTAMETILTAYSARHPHSNGDPTHRLLRPSHTQQWRPDSPLTPPVTHTAMST